MKDPFPPPYLYGNFKPVVDCTATGPIQPPAPRPSVACDALGPPPPAEAVCWERPCDDYGWDFGEWSSCSAACGGGTQTRAVTCLDRTGAVSSPESCATAGLGAAPAVEQVCNSVACPAHAWAVLGDWSPCSRSCGPGFRTRTVACIADGASVVGSALCAAALRPVAVEACTSNCSVAHWSAGPWSACSAQCGGGSRNRSIVCLVNGAPALDGDRSCAEAPQPAGLEACNGWPCETFAWMVGDWAPCNASCGGGAMLRTVLCVSSRQGAMPLAFCAGSGPPPPWESLCGMEACDPCSTSPPCSGHGSCGASTRVCTCEAAYSGADCGQRNPCADGEVQDQTGACCAGVRDRYGGCCSRPLALDACGVCEGSAVAVDAGGACCAGVLDGGGWCCSSKKLDACGVCEGTGTTCGTNIQLRVGENLSAVGADFSGEGLCTRCEAAMPY
jgi:hypothetical protein